MTWLFQRFSSHHSFTRLFFYKWKKEIILASFIQVGFRINSNVYILGFLTKLDTVWNPWKEVLRQHDQSAGNFFCTIDARATCTCILRGCSVTKITIFQTSVLLKQLHVISQAWGRIAIQWIQWSGKNNVLRVLLAQFLKETFVPTGVFSAAQDLKMEWVVVPNEMSLLSLVNFG